MIKAIIFDFDGVIVDSMNLKTEAFINLFQEYPNQLIEKFVRFHLDNGGISRFVKIRFFYENILKEGIDDKKIEQLALKFSAYVKSRLSDPSFLIADTCRFLEANFNRFEFHIASGAEESELKFLVEKLGISRYFLSVHGSPASKEAIIEKILSKFSYSPEDIALIGDSRNDLEAASLNKIKFLGYNNPELKCENDCCYIERMDSFILK